MIVATDDDVRRLTATEVVAVLRDALKAHHTGALAAPPRLVAHLPEVNWDHLLFTVGASEQSIGFRVGGGAPDPRIEQFTAVFDRAAGRLVGIVVGNQLGARRTAALAAIATDQLARKDSRILGLVGAGRQAAAHVWAVQSVRQLEEVRVFSRDRARREQFARQCSSELGLRCVAADSARHAVEGADLVTLTTTSASPVIDDEWIAEGTHVATLGPNTVDEHEAPFDLAARADVLVTDSVAQLSADNAPSWLTAAGRFDDVRALSAVIAGEAMGRRSVRAITMFCSTGLAGTEVLLAAEVLRRTMQDEAVTR